MKRLIGENEKLRDKIGTPEQFEYRKKMYDEMVSVMLEFQRLNRVRVKVKQGKTQELDYLKSLENALDPVK